jgi:hypothetical protein
VIATSEQYPHLFQAMSCIEDETTTIGSLRVPVREIPDRWGPFLSEANETIGKLSQTERSPDSEPLPAHVKPNDFLDSEFYTFCNGEYHEMSALESRHRSSRSFAWS